MENKQKWLDEQTCKLIDGFNKRECGYGRKVALNKVKSLNLGENTSIYGFGVCAGYSGLWIEQLIRKLGIKYHQHLLFDSFIGLPDEIPGIPIESSWTKSNYSTLNEFKCETIENAVLLIKEFYSRYQFFPKIVQGFYNEALPLLDIPLLKSASFIDCDVDLYSSAKTVLTWMSQSKLIVPGTIINYDDWFGTKLYQGGESLAHKEWIECFKVRGSFVLNNGNDCVYQVEDIKI